MHKETECRRLAELLGWREITSLSELQNLGVPDSVHGQSIWFLPPSHPKLGFLEVVWVHELNFDPWEDANDDLSVLQYFKDRTTPEIWSYYKDALYHETKGHGTHNVWEYKKGKFANAAIMLADKLGWR